MAKVTDGVGREFDFSSIRFKMDEDLLQQASLDIGDLEKNRTQALFDCYLTLHRQKYGRIFQPSHFGNGRLLARYQNLYLMPPKAIRITVEVGEGALFDRFAGASALEVETAFRRDPGAWIRAGQVVRLPEG